jgi:hypothetical protein
MADNRRNPNNADSDLFKRLTRLFSGPIVNHRAQAVRNQRRKQMDRYATKFTSASGKQFKKQDYNVISSMVGGVYGTQNRGIRYTDFDQMEYTPEIASALDIYADEMTTSSDLQQLLKIRCPNEEIKLILDNLYHNVMNLEHNLFGWCRTMCKYGDYFLYVDIDETIGVKNVISLPTRDIERLEGEDETNPNYVQYQWNSAGLTFENWQVAHFRILGNDRYAPYGTSVLEPARRIWRQLTLLEDAMMAYRIVRSPERRVFKIDVGNLPPEEIEQYMQKVMTQMKRNQVVDSDSGRVDLRYNPLSVDEDYFIPVRQGSASEITTLPGGQYTGDIDDVKYLRDKLFAALKIPASYLSRAEGAEEDKATLAQKDIRFARTIQRLQRVVISELEKIGIIHLFTLGYRGDDLISFKVSLNNPSKIAELQELEHWKTKFEVANQAVEGFFSKRWVAKHLFNISDEEFVRNQREMFYDRYHTAKLDGVAEQVNQAAAVGGAPATEGGGLDLTGGDEGGGLDLEGGAAGADTPAAGGDAAAEPAAGGDAAGGGDETLLAAPGKRNDMSPDRHDHLYEPVKFRGGDRRTRGARNRSNKAQYSREMASNTPRNTFKGAMSAKDMIGGSIKDMMFQEQMSNYTDEDEQRLLQVTDSVKGLISELKLKQQEEKTELNENNGKVKAQ